MFDRVAACAALRRGAFVTELAGTKPLDARSQELEAQREAARRGCAIERALLLVDPARGAESDVRELAELDAAAGVRSYAIDAANALPPVDLPSGALDFAVYDEEVLCTPAGRRSWRASRDRADLDRALSAADALRGARSPARELVVEEPLATSAPFARMLAPLTCDPVGPGIPDCAPYHGLVQDLRLLGVVASPQRAGRFYRAHLSALAESGHPRLLIAGAADYSMLAHTLASYDAAGSEPQVTVIDRCATPLLLCRWFAARKGVPIDTAVEDIAEFRTDEPFDVVCADALLVMIAAADKPAALAGVAGALRPGGRFVTSIRIAPDAAGGPQRFGSHRAAAFAGGAREEAVRRADLLGFDPDRIERDAYRYADSIVVHPAESQEQLTDLFDGAGLRLEELVTTDVAGRTTTDRVGPGSHQTASYAYMVAVRD